MYKTLSPHAIGVNPPDLQTALAYAKAGGFAGLEVSAPAIADLIDKIGIDSVKKMFADAGIRPAAFGLPVEWRQSEEKYQADLKILPRSAHAAAMLGVTRCCTWVMPCSNEREKDANWKFHVQRFRPIAQTLESNGQRLGLEFIGPKTIRDAHKHPFIWTSGEMLQLAGEIGPNVGLLLDCWHWYTSHGTLDELKALKPEDVVYVHVNDAPRNVDIDKQIDNVRMLPGETGVIDIAGFLKALKQIGYDGPVTPEPFRDDLKKLPDDAARIKLVGESMARIWSLAGF